MVAVNVYEAKKHLSRLLARVLAGDVVVIAPNGTPIARLVPIAGDPARVFAVDEGRFVVPGDFDGPLPDDDVVRAFGGAPSLRSVSSVS